MCVYLRSVQGYLSAGRARSDHASVFFCASFFARTLQITWNTKVGNRTVGRFCKAHRATLFSEIRQQVVGHFFIHCADQRELRTQSKEMHVV